MVVTRTVLAAFVTSLLAVACAPSQGPVADPLASPGEAVSEPTDGALNEIEVE